MFWIGWQYADLGFFADGAEALGELCSRFDDAAARRLLAEVVWWRDNAHRIPWLPPAGDGSLYDRMMDLIDPAAPKTKEYLREARNENQKERIAPYHPSIDKKLASLFSTVIAHEDEKPATSIVDWSFLDADDGQPGEPVDWVKKRIRMYEKWKDELHAEMFEDLKRMHKLTRNIPPPSKPKRCDPNEPPFNPSEILGEFDEDDEDDDL